MRIIYFLITSIFFAGCYSAAKENKPGTEISEKKTVNVKTVAVKEDRPRFSLRVPGELLPYEQVDIYAKINGFVQKLYVDRGSYVQKGQILVRLEAAEMEEEFSARKSVSGTAYQQYLFSKQSYERLKSASKKSGAVATIELEKAYSQFLADSAKYKSTVSLAAAAGKLQSYLEIRAPFSGIITERFVSEGALVGAGTRSEPLFQLSQQNKLRLTVSIPEEQANAIPDDAFVTFSVIDLPGRTFEAKLSRTSGALSPVTRSVTAEFDIPNEDLLLSAGQYADVKLQLIKKEPTMWVPRKSVVNSQAGTFVLVVRNDSAMRIPVHKGISQETYTEIFGAIKPGERVIAEGTEEIQNGTIVSVTDKSNKDGTTEIATK